MGGRLGETGWNSTQFYQGARGVAGARENPKEFPLCRLCGKPVLPGTEGWGTTRKHRACLKLRELWYRQKGRAERRARILREVGGARPDLGAWLSELLDTKPGMLSTGLATPDAILDLWRQGWGRHLLRGPVRTWDVRRVFRSIGIRAMRSGKGAPRFWILPD
jgi:hypothetical protein